MDTGWQVKIIKGQEEIATSCFSSFVKWHFTEFFKTKRDTFTVSDMSLYQHLWIIATWHYHSHFATGKLQKFVFVQLNYLILLWMFLRALLVHAVSTQCGHFNKMSIASDFGHNYRLNWVKAEGCIYFTYFNWFLGGMQNNTLY